MNRAEVWWCDDPDRGRRPMCILTRNAAIPVLASVVVAPATTNVRGIPTEVALDEGDGMPRPCALRLDDLAAIPKAWLAERITRLSIARQQELCRALRVATAC